MLLIGSLFLITHYFWVFLAEQYPQGYERDRMTVVGGILVWQTSIWFTCFLTEFLDEVVLPRSPWLQRHKLHAGVPKKVSFWDMFPITLRNDALMAVMAYFLLINSTWMLHPIVVSAADSEGTPCAVWRSALWFFVMFLGYDAVFYVAHRVMHFNKHIYSAVHKLHHNTVAVTGISHHYMTIPDVLGEVFFPVYIPIVLFGAYAPALWSLLVVGGVNGVIVHSGYALPFCPPPYNHALHHKPPFRKNISLGVTDLLAGSFQDGAEFFKSVAEVGEIQRTKTI